MIVEHISWQNPFINNGGPNFSSVMAMFGSSTIFHFFLLVLLQFLEVYALHFFACDLLSKFHSAVGYFLIYSVRSDIFFKSSNFHVKFVSSFLAESVMITPFHCKLLWY